MLYEKITQLNQTVMDGLNEHDEANLIRSFVDAGIDILDADFGFVWLDSYSSKDLEMVYKSPGTPYNPLPPQKGGRNRNVLMKREPDYVSAVKKRSDKYDVSRYMKSFVIIPISFRDKTYGNIIFCFKRTELFAKEKRLLCAFIGNVAAQAITIRRLTADEQEKVKTEFLAEATHELRTPLAIIRGSVDLALQAKLNSQTEITRTLKDINYEVSHMSGIVSDLSVLVNSGKSFRKKFMSHRIILEKILERTVKRLEGYAKKKPISLNLGKIPDVIVTGDEMYLDKMFGNVIRNAIIYGKEKGTVAIRVRLAGSDRNPFVHIDIEDDGIGIPKDAVPHIFDRFYRADNAREKNHEGTGLGLAIVKFIAEAHGGRVSLLKSKEGAGSVFRLTLPASSR